MNRRTNNGGGAKTKNFLFRLIAVRKLLSGTIAVTILMCGCFLPWILESRLTKFASSIESSSNTDHHNNIVDHPSPHNLIRKNMKNKPSYPAAMLVMNDKLMKKNDTKNDNPPPPQQQQQQQNPKEEANTNNQRRRQPLILPPDDIVVATKKSSDEPLILHFIVSSGCSEYQQWEVVTQIHSARKIGQFGRYTWILSGCLPEDHFESNMKEVEGEKERSNLKPSQIEQIVQHHFPADSSQQLITPNLHFTPDYSNMSIYGGLYANGTIQRTFTGRNGEVQRSPYGNHYYFNNKPNSLLHWATEYYGNNPNRLEEENEVIVVIDPDFLFVKKFHFMDMDSNQSPSPGKPMAAKYGLGGQWLDFNRTDICGNNSNCTKVLADEIDKYYNVGPPYIIHSQDVLLLVGKWVQFVPPTYDQYPLLYAEMFAYSMAAAHLNLPHTCLDNIFMGCMIPWPELSISGDPGPSAKEFRETFGADFFQANTDDGPSSCFLPELKTPPFIHYCQRYPILSSTVVVNNDDNNNANTSITQSEYLFFAKRRIPQNVLECDQPPMRLFESKPDDNAFYIDRPDWMTLTACAVIRAINYARKQHCQHDFQKQQ